MKLNDLAHPAAILPAEFDGFSLHIDPQRERADIVLSRPPLNVINMGQRDQLRIVFEALDVDDRVRVIVLRSEGEHFSSGGDIRGFLEASPNMCPSSPGMWRRRRVAASRSSPRQEATVLAWDSNSRWPAIFAW